MKAGFKKNKEIGIYERNHSCRWIRNKALSDYKSCFKTDFTTLRQTDDLLSVKRAYACRNPSELIKEYDANLEPCVYDGFIDTAKKVLTQEHKKNLKKLLNFKFKKHPKYNLGAIRLRKIEDQVQRNVMELLG